MQQEHGDAPSVADGLVQTLGVLVRSETLYDERDQHDAHAQVGGRLRDHHQEGAFLTDGLARAQTPHPTQVEGVEESGEAQQQH